MKIAYIKTAIGFVLVFTILSFTLETRSPGIVRLFKESKSKIEKHSRIRVLIYAMLYSLVAALIIYYIERAKHWNLESPKISLISN